MVVNEWYESVWSYVMVCDCIWWCMGVYVAHMDVYESIWWYMNVNVHKWEYIKVYEALR